jgi:SAM-dependent methyltransferase
LRKDNLPYPHSAVQNIYCSHVLEHVEEEHVERFFLEAFRVLKPGGTLRIAVPDARFLFNVSRIDSEYWSWNSTWSVPGTSRGKRLHPLDYLIQELVTSRFRLVPESHAPLKPSDIENLSYDEAIELLRSEARLFPDKPNYHVSTWDYFSLERLAKASGFSTILESKVRGSVSSRMQAVGFDTTHPEMTLYIDCVK